MSISRKLIVCLLAFLVLSGVAWWIFAFSPMNIDAVKEEVATTLRLDDKEIQYVCGGRNGCKTIAFEYIGNGERFVRELDTIGMVVFTSKTDKDYYARRLMLLEGQSEVIKSIDRGSPDLHIYDIKGLRIYEFRGRYIIVVSN